MPSSLDFEPLGDNVAVKITVSVEYALQALTEIAHQDEVPLSAQEISSRQAISTKYLESILRKLTNAGILVSSRGPQGGYRLSRSADEVTVADVIRAIEGPLAAVGDRAPEETKYRRTAKHLTEVWIATRIALRDVLERITLAEIVTGDFDSRLKQALKRRDAWSRRVK